MTTELSWLNVETQHDCRESKRAFVQSNESMFTTEIQILLYL